MMLKTAFMKHLFLTIPILLFIYSCGGTSEKTEMVDPNSIQLSEVRHDSLTQSQLDRIQFVYQSFEEVYPSTLEETITNFKRDLNPDNEIKIWEHMAVVFTKYASENPTPDKLEHRKEAFKLILMRSMMNNESAISESELTLLSEYEIKSILENYSFEAKPITVEEK